MHQIDDIPIATFFQLAGSNHGHSTRGATVITGEGVGEDVNITSGLNIVMPKPKGDIRKYSFSHRVVSKWNNLPNSIKFAKSVNEFKNLLDNHTGQMRPFGVL